MDALGQVLVVPDDAAAELGPNALRFLDGLLKAQRYGKGQAGKVLALLGAYARKDLLAEATAEFSSEPRSASSRALTTRPGLTVSRWKFDVSPRLWRRRGLSWPGRAAAWRPSRRLWFCPASTGAATDGAEKPARKGNSDR